MARKRRRRPHGQGSVYQRGPSNFWIQWREGGVRRTRGGFATRDLAERVLARIVSNVQIGAAGLPLDPTSQPALCELAPDWLERRAATHRAIRDDRCRWTKHLAPTLGTLRPMELDTAKIRQLIERKLGEGLAPATVGHCIKLLSTFFADLVERGFVETNPVSRLPRSARRLYRPTNDSINTRFLERTADIERVYAGMPEPYNVAFAIGALAGLRTGEILGLAWENVDLDARRVVVRQQVHRGSIGPLKDDDSRVAPILDALAPTLSAWKLKTGGVGFVIRPNHAARGGRPGRPPAFVRPNTLRLHLAKALRRAELKPGLTWYQATRHTFASQWVLADGSMEKLSAVLGHSSVTVTQRYAHLRPDLFRDSDYRVIQVDLLPRCGDVVRLPTRVESGTASYAGATPPLERAGSVR